MIEKTTAGACGHAPVLFSSLHQGRHAMDEFAATFRLLRRLLALNMVLPALPSH
jgi:hypothetical protein